MLKQIRYFQSVVQLGSFTDAANEHFISQLAISQQIRALEAELGVVLLVRKKRSFTLTAAGKYFYKKSLVLVADYDVICRETQRIAGQSGEHERALNHYAVDNYAELKKEAADLAKDKQLLNILKDYYSGEKNVMHTDMLFSIKACIGVFIFAGRANDFTEVDLCFDPDRAHIPQAYPPI